jgi:nucleoside-diphosphate-sugar epimerase
MPRVLVTGATGFLGSHITEVLVQHGFTVRCTVRPSSSLKWLENLELEKVNVNFSDEASLQTALMLLFTMQALPEQKTMLSFLKSIHMQLKNLLKQQ